MNQELSIKLIGLKRILQEMGSVAVAFSGGVDSTLLLKVATETLGFNAIGIYCDSVLMPARERKMINEIAHQIGAKLQTFSAVNLRDLAFSKHPEDRCYLCKANIFDHILQIAEEGKFGFVIDGSNTDDQKDYRPGKKALQERGIRSPLEEANLNKEEIRLISKAYKLPTWDKDALACLATRIPFGTSVTKEKLLTIDRVEELLVSEGFKSVRARLHADRMILEVHETQVNKLKEKIKGNKFQLALREIYSSAVIINDKGYHTGNMNTNITL